MSGPTPSLFEELKQRKVIRVAIAYAVVAWVALQFFDLVLDNVDADPWIMQAIMAVLAFGFPVSLALAWAFDLTPGGIRLAPGRSALFSASVAGITLAVAGYVGWTFLGAPADPAGEEAVATSGDVRVIDSIAVLPFESFSTDQQDEYFADGLADTLLHKLAQLENLKVIARNSSFQFKGSNKDAREIGDILDVAALLEGSVQRQGEQVRIIAQLIDTADGTHIWSSTFDDSFRNIFELQDRIAQAIMQQLKISISEREARLVLRNGTDSPEAYDLLMRAMQTEWNLQRESFNPASNEMLAFIDRAIEIDPDYAQAWVARSGVFSSALFFGTDPDTRRQYLAETRRAAERAVEIDPDYAAGYARLGWAHFRARDIPRAEALFIRALELNPQELDAMQGLGLIKVNDDPQVALDLFSKVRELDPQDSFVYRQLYFALDALGRLEDGIATLEEGIERFPWESILKADLASIYINDYGRIADGALLAADIVRSDGQDRIGLAMMRNVWSAVGDVDRANAWNELYASRFPDSTGGPRARAHHLLLSGDAAAAKTILDSIPESPDFRFDRATSIGGVCLVLADLGCLEEQAGSIERWLDEYEAQGREYGPGERYRIAAAVLSNAARPVESRDVEELEAQLALSENWALTGGRGFRYTRYQRVMLQSLLGRDEDAVDELARTLALDDDGVLYSDIFLLPPPMNPLVSRLAGVAGYGEWQNEFEARLEKARGALVQMEASGDILTVDQAAL